VQCLVCSLSYFFLFSLNIILIFEPSPVAGAKEKIARLRYRHEIIADSVAQLENRVARNTAELEQMRHSYDDDDENDFSPQQDIPEITDEDLERELAEIAELERKKRALEARVTGMDRDFNGLMG